MLGKEKFIIIDIDGTIANNDHRVEFVSSTPKDWDKFYDKCDEDTPITKVCDLVDLFISNGYRPIFVTGRPERVRDKTVKWLDENVSSFVKKDLIFMRKNHDFTPDFEYKKSVLYKSLTTIGVTPDNTFILEDRDSCVKMWREEGFTVLQTADGAY